LGHHESVRFYSLPNLLLTSILSAALGLAGTACGRKGDPVPRTRSAPASCTARWVGPRILEVRLPLRDVLGTGLVGLEKVRVVYLPLGYARPTGEQVLARGVVVMERSRPNLPRPGEVLRLDLSQIGRAPGWLVATAVRVGDVVGAPSEPVPWLDPAL
jgi:hypothetical protein